MTGTELAKICIRHSRDPHIIVDDQDNVVFGNPAFHTLFNLPENVPLTLARLGPLDLRQALDDASTNAHAGPMANVDFTLSVDLDGESLPLRVIEQSVRMQGDERLRLITLQPLRRRSEESETLTTARAWPTDTLRSLDGECRKALAFARKVAGSDVRVVILGESGTGKTRVARALHRLSPRAGKPFVEVNCAAIPEELLESELFGHVRGAFSGAVNDREGRFEAAHGGTLFLDEIGEMSPKLQAKLLRAVQDGTFERVGENQSRIVDVRVVAASNKDLRSLVASGEFRSDLFYRLAVATVFLPPLRERPLDLQQALDEFESANEVRLASDLRSKLMAYSWPGNFRELENAFQCMCLRSRNGEIRDFELSDPLVQATSGIQSAAANLPSNDGEGADTTSPPDAVAEDSLARASEDAEARRLREALIANAGNRTRTARELGMDRTTLWRKMHRYNLA
ncbi:MULTISPECIES: sigma-54-dependent Fis family transcriptional regulator [unclassified Thioalkalivibrio]|uniref:sigma-54 interaction domain-containing protein n=1 Tax=unclassified Thioalkalivibrio TaxID=2621013 RepID=UPI000375100A|nr:MULTISPECIES: sigma-54 dependent transcriptional regulator [unclassified Thioalkalivibrio]